LSPVKPKLVANQASPLVVVGISELRVTNDPGATLVTYGLGSCIAVCIYDPRNRIGGLLHYMLPVPSIAPDKAASRPAMFGDVGIPLLFRRVMELGANRRDLVVKVAGASRVQDHEGVFNIGGRNYAVLCELLRKNHIPIAAEDVGGTGTRTVRMCIRDGRVTVRSAGEEIYL
jgi:chemotaxis protein CheD